MSLFNELKRRNVFRVALAYLLVAWVLLQAADFALDLIDAPNWVIQALFLLAALGLPVVLVFSWVYEMTPEGLKREHEVQRVESIAPSTGRKLDRIIITFLAVAVALLLTDRFMQPGDPAVDEQATAEAPAQDQSADKPATAAPEMPSIAVLPFVNMSSDKEQEYFADGISEEILNSLARVSGLKVAGRTSSFAFKGQNQDLREIGEALGVENILEGSVRKQGDQVRITAQLVQVSDGFHLWSDTYDRTLEDIFAIQDEIASAILRETKIQLLDEEVIASTRVDPAAYQNYLAAKQRIHERTKGGLETAANLLQDAVTMDPTFASAWAQRGIATLLLSDGFGSYGDIPEPEAQATGRQYLEKALELDPENAEALAGMGLFWQNEPPISATNVNKAVEYLQRSIAINPGLIDTSHWLGRAYQFLGRSEDAQALLEEMAERDPFYWPAVSSLVNLYARKNRLADAHELNDRTMRYRPELPFRQKSILHSFEGEYGKALPYAMEVWNERKDPLTFISVAIAMNGLGEFETLADMDRAPDRGSKAYALAVIGRAEEAKMVAQTAFRERGFPSVMINTLAVSGDFEALQEFIESRWDSLADYEEEFSAFGGFGHQDMLDIALAYQALGKEARFGQALSLARREHDSQLGEGFDTFFLDLAEAQYWTLAGDQQVAIDKLQKAVDRGYSATPRMSQAVPQLKPLEGDPRFEAIQAQSLAYMNEQRALLDLPPLEAAY